MDRRGLPPIFFIIFLVHLIVKAINLIAYDSRIQGFLFEKKKKTKKTLTLNPLKSPLNPLKSPKKPSDINEPKLTGHWPKGGVAETPFWEVQCPQREGGLAEREPRY